MFLDLILSSSLNELLLRIYLCKANNKRGCEDSYRLLRCVTDSPTEKSPVVSLTEEEAKPTISVFAIFKQARDLHKDNIN